jgi:hypothetical protein
MIYILFKDIFSFLPALVFLYGFVFLKESFRLGTSLWVGPLQGNKVDEIETIEEKVIDELLPKRKEVFVFSKYKTLTNKLLKKCESL